MAILVNGLSASLSPLTMGVNAGAARAAGPNDAPGVDFQELFLKSVEQVNELDRQSQSAVARMLTGDDLTQAEVFTEMKKADLAFRTMLQIRNKLLEAYNELKNMRM